MVRVGTPGLSPTIRRAIRAGFVLASLLLLASCNSATLGTSVEGSQLDITDKVRSIDLLPRQTQPVNATAAVSAGGNRAAPAALYESAAVTTVSDATTLAECAYPAQSRRIPAPA